MIYFIADITHQYKLDNFYRITPVQVAENGLSHLLLYKSDYTAGETFDILIEHKITARFVAPYLSERAFELLFPQEFEYIYSENKEPKELIFEEMFAPLVNVPVRTKTAVYYNLSEFEKHSMTEDVAERYNKMLASNKQLLNLTTWKPSMNYLFTKSINNVMQTDLSQIEEVSAEEQNKNFFENVVTDFILLAHFYYDKVDIDTWIKEVFINQFSKFEEGE